MRYLPAAQLLTKLRLTVHKNVQTLYLYSFISLLAFAANSILCRIALKGDYIDATSFTLLRLLSAAVVLFLLVFFNPSQPSAIKLNKQVFAKYWLTSLMLFLYALSFSFAYISLSTGTGALILFGFVQITLVITSIIYGHKVDRLTSLGLGIALFGLGYLVYPSLLLPSFVNFILMSISGIAWGIYTLKGQNSQAPLLDTFYNFVFTIPLILLVTLFMLPSLSASAYGIVLSIASGGIMSALGYALWYKVVKHFTFIQSGVLQLSVPIIAALAGAMMLDEGISLSVAIATTLILTGIYLTLLGKKRRINNLS